MVKAIMELESAAIAGIGDKRLITAVLKVSSFMSCHFLPPQIIYKETTNHL